MEVGAWLRSLGLEQYEAAFTGNDIDAHMLPRLTAEDLKELGVTSVGHRKRMLEAIAALASLSSGGDVARDEPSPKEAERRHLTVMFVDLVGSTALSQRLDPEDMREVIRTFQNAVAGEITRFEGHVAEFMGDGVLAYFGWPRSHEDEAERSVRAALAIVGTVVKLTGGGRAAVVPDWYRDRPRCRRGRCYGAGRGGRRDAEFSLSAAGHCRAW
jgi:class 3 adenylate cyclase